MKKVLVIDDDKNILTTLQIYIEESGMVPVIADSGAKGIGLFKAETPEVVLLDLKLPDMDGLSVLDQIVATGIKSYVVVVTAYATIDTAVKAIKMGAFDYLPKPFTPSQVSHLLEMIERVHSLETELESLKGIVREGDFITRNRNMRKILKMARQVAESNASVLISGESGTGKGVLARLMHDWSPRSGGPFTTVDCAGLQENLLESDLFGHVKGAFTGALRDKVGKLQLANGGTVFLDEIAEIPPPVQAKFLHFLQYHEFARLGDPNLIRVDVRVIAATNKDLDELVKDERFRQDLYFRLNVIEIFMPPLRERPDDIQLLAEYYLERFSKLNKKKVRGLSDEILPILTNYPWPGNIRELINVIERGVILSNREYLIPTDLPEHISDYQKGPQQSDIFKTIAELEKSHVKEVLLQTKSIEEAAQVLGIDPATLWRKRKKYALD
jgi:NtrC-family two-component system response regulator AlgB